MATICTIEPSNQSSKYFTVAEETLIAIGPNDTCTMFTKKRPQLGVVFIGIVVHKCSDSGSGLNIQEFHGKFRFYIIDYCYAFHGLQCLMPGDNSIKRESNAVRK